jgi:hypothetical protein
MASLVRPTKRQKQDHASEEVFLESEVSNVNKYLGSTELLPLVEWLADTPLARNRDVIEIIGRIRSHRDLRENKSPDVNNDHDKISSVRKLHGTLILYIGFLLGSYKQTSTSNKNWAELLSSLIFCLRDLYASNYENLSKYDAEYDVEEQFHELFNLIPKLLLSPSSSSKELKKMDVVQLQMRQRSIIMPCYQIIKVWLDAPILLKKVLSKSTTLMSESFLFGILKSRYIITFRCTNKEDHSLEILQRLLPLCEDNSDFQKHLDVALLAMHYQNLSRGHAEPRFNIFYWRCVYCVIFEEGNTTGNNAEIEIADRAVDSLMIHIEGTSRTTNRLLSGLAMACLCEFTQNSNYDSHIRLLKIFVKIVATKAGVNLIQALRCFGLCVKKAYAMDYFLQMDDWATAFNNLIYLAEHERNDTTVAEEAAKLLILISKALITKAHHHSSVLFRKSMKVLTQLVSWNHTYIVETTLEVLFTLLQNLEIRRHAVCSTLTPKLVNALAKLASTNMIVEDSKKAKLAQTFSILIDEMRNIQFLVENNSSNLAFLVCLTTGSYCETDQNRAQQISICAIVKLSRNPCNRRILAKEPGLLSSLIRYIRSRVVPEDTEFFRERNVSRNEMMGRIVRMADVL